MVSSLESLSVPPLLQLRSYVSAKTVGAVTFGFCLLLLLGWHLAPGDANFTILPQSYPDCARFPCTFEDVSPAAVAPLHVELKVCA